MQARIWVGEGEHSVEKQEGKHAGEVLELDDLVSGDNVFFAATGITSGELLEGVRFLGEDRCHTQSLVMRSYSGTSRYIDAEHNLAKLRRRRDPVELASKGEARPAPGG